MLKNIHTNSVNCGAKMPPIFENVLHSPIPELRITVGNISDANTKMSAKDPATHPFPRTAKTVVNQLRLDGKNEDSIHARPHIVIVEKRTFFRPKYCIKKVMATINGLSLRASAAPAA